MKQKILIYSIAAASLLAACGEDSPSSPSTNSSGVSQISSSSVVDIPASSAKESSDSKKILTSSSSNTQSSSSKETIPSSASTKGFPANYNQETGLLTDERDGEIYKTVKIGNQIWMAQSLRYLPTEPAQNCDFTWVKEIEDADQLASYGRHYSWTGATRLSCDLLSQTISFGSDGFSLPHQGVCPKGWHIPTQAEFQALAEAVNNQISSLLSTDWLIISGTDDYGFNILKPQNDNNIIDFIILENSGKWGYSMAFHNIGTTAVMETSKSAKSADSIYLRCLMD